MQGQGGADSERLLAAATLKHWVAYDLEGYVPRSDPLPRPASAACDTGSDLEPGPGCTRFNFNAVSEALRSCLLSCKRLTALLQHVNNRDLFSFYSAPFLSAIEAGARSIMCAYSGILGAPACGSPLINSMLRDALHWDGHVVSDCTALELMGDVKFDNCQPPYPPTTCKPDYFPGHNFTHGVADTANAALSAGTDTNCGPLYRMWLSTLLANGSVSAAAVDQSVTRLLRTHFKLGLLDPSGPSRPYSLLGAADVDTPAHRQLALNAARASLVLLKNDNNTLPLPNYGRGLKIAFIGPHANATDALLSNYHGENRLVYKHSPLAAALARGLDVTYAQGCNICDTPTPNNFPCTTLHYNTSGIADAAAAAAAADVAVLFVGSDQTTEAENFDRQSITLAGVQELLLKAILASNPNTIGGCRR